MKVYFTKHKETIKSIFLALQEEVASDDYPHPDEVDFDYMIEHDLFVAVEQDEVVGGVFYIHAKGPGIWQGHIQMLPQYRGDIADAAMEETIKLLRRAQPVTKIITQVPSLFKNVAAFLKRHGFRRTDVLEDLYMRHGKQYPIFVYEREFK